MEEKIKTIAIFMGLFQDDKGFWGFKNTPERQRCHSDRIKDIYQYDRDWNLLMSVVEKILNICAENDDLEKYAVITDNIPYIQQTYDECIKFINFYNKQKEE